MGLIRTGPKTKGQELVFWKNWPRIKILKGNEPESQKDGYNLDLLQMLTNKECGRYPTS